MGHDQRFKEFLHAFLRDFLRLFFPDVETLGVEEYGERGGPAGAGLAALMDRSAIGDIERLRASLMGIVRWTVQSELDEARQFILIDLIQTYFGLTAEQMARYRRLVSRKKYRKVYDVENCAGVIGSGVGISPHAASVPKPVGDRNLFQ